MKIALVYPEVYDVARFKEKRKEFPPFGVLYLASVLEEGGHWVRLFPVDSTLPRIDLSDYEVVGFSIPSSVSWHIIKGVRERSHISSNALLLAGGVHATIYPEHTLESLKVSAVVIGPGEETIRELITVKDFSGVPGICYRHGRDVVRTQNRKLKNDLDHLPVLPARHLLPESDLFLNDRLANTDLKMTHVMMTQGCPYSCNFCASQQKKILYRSGLHVKKELVHLMKKYSIDGFAVVGDNFLVSKGRVKEICEQIKGLGLKWSTLSRVDSAEYEMLELMYDAGCIEVKYGIESGSKLMLEAMGKGVTTDQIRNAIKITTSIGLKVKVFLVHGYPGENLETTMDTINLLNDMAPLIERVSLFRFAPLPGSYVYENYKKFGLRIEDSSVDWAKCHIHHNHYHWWGSKRDYNILNKSYKLLDKFILENWG